MAGRCNNQMFYREDFVCCGVEGRVELTTGSDRQNSLHESEVNVIIPRAELLFL